MATSRPKSGVNEYSITTGPGPLTLTGPVSGFRGFVSADDGLVYPYGIYQEGIAFETGLGTYTHASRQLSRTTILGNINNTTVPLTLGAGTKEVSVVIPGERVVMADVENQFLADQRLSGNRLYLDAAGTDWIDMTTAGTFRLYIASVLAWEGTGGLGNLTLFGSNDTATEGPELTLRRDSASPAASDALFVIRGQGKDASGTTQSSFKMANRWLSTTAGSHSSALDLSIAASGALQTILTLRPGFMTLSTIASFFTAGKQATSLTTGGAEFFTNGSAYIVCVDGTTPLVVARGAGDGTYINFVSNGTVLGDIHNTSGTVSVGAFTGNHYGDFATGVLPEYELPGTVLAGTGNLLPAASEEPFYELIPASSGDRRVLGVYGGRKRTGIMGGEERNLIVLWAVGNGRIRAIGPIAAGNLLWASDQPGIAEAQPNQDQVGPWTVAKATNDSLDNGDERLVSCIYMAG